jgi:PAS domain-containing protein
VVDSSGTIVPGGVNVAVERLSGWSEDELVGRCFEAADPASWLGSDEPPTFESPYVTRAGERRDIEWTARRLEGQEGTRYLLCGTDVTDWRRQQARLRASRARIVAAGDSERRRLERNLHDGAQQRLVSVPLGCG